MSRRALQLEWSGSPVGTPRAVLDDPLKDKGPEILRDSRPLLGGDGRDRTDDLLNAIQALSQLSYIPKDYSIGSSLPFRERRNINGGSILVKSTEQSAFRAAADSGARRSNRPGLWCTSGASLEGRGCGT